MDKKASQNELENRVRQLEKELGRQNRFKGISYTLFNISKAVNTASNLVELYELIHKALSKIIDTTNFYIARYDKSQDKVTFPYFVDSVDDCYPDVINVSKTESLTAAVIQTGLPSMITKDEILKQRQQTKKSVPSCTPSMVWLGVPLKVQDDIIGVMTVQSYIDETLYDGTDMEVMASVADQVALAIEHKKSEQILQDSEKRYRTLFESSIDALAILDVDTGQFIDCNKAAVKIYGTGTKGNFVSSTPEELSPEFQPGGESSQKLAQEHIKTAFEKRSNVFEWIHARPDGTLFPALITLSAMQIGGDNLVLSIGRDLTDIKREEEKKDRLIEELKTALSEVKNLSGLLPICCTCKKIRDDKGYWKQIETYISAHSEADFSHSICPDCAKELYPDIDIYD